MQVLATNDYTYYSAYLQQLTIQISNVLLESADKRHVVPSWHFGFVRFLGRPRCWCSKGKSVEINIHSARHGQITIIIFIDPYDDRSSYEINDFGLVTIKVPTTPQPVIDNKILSIRHSRPCTQEKAIISFLNLFHFD